MAQRALVVDDHPLVCDALTLAIQMAAPQMGVEHTHSLAGMRDEVRPGRDLKLVALDLMLPDALGFSGLLMAQQAFPEAKVVIVSARNDEHTIALASLFGAAGYIIKTTPLLQMQTAFRRVLDGDPMFPDAVSTVSGYGSVQASRSVRAFRGLSPAQLRVLVALADGQPTKIVAHDLGISEAGVKAHLTQLFRTFAVNNRSQLVLVARQLEGLGEPLPA